MEPANQQQFEYEIMRELEEQEEDTKQKDRVFEQMSCVLEKIGFNERFK